MFQPMIGADNGPIDSVRKSPSEWIGWSSHSRVKRCRFNGPQR